MTIRAHNLTINVFIYKRVWRANNKFISTNKIISYYIFIFKINNEEGTPTSGDDNNQSQRINI